MVKHSRIVFICVKPQYVKVVLEEVKDLLTDEHVIVSIAAGVPIATLKVCCPCRLSSSSCMCCTVDARQQQHCASIVLGFLNL